MNYSKESELADDEIPGAWEEPPPKKETRDYDAISKGLQRNPMKWRKFEQERTTVPNAIKAGKIPALHPSLGFEVETRNNTRGPIGPRMCTMFIRFNPDKTKE